MSAFMVGPETMRRVIDAAHALDAIGISATPAARYLWALNAWAMRERYNGRLEPGELDARALSHTPRPFRTRRDALLAFKALHCLSYQCAEGAAYESEPYNWLEAVTERFARRICARMLNIRSDATIKELNDRLYNTAEWHASGNWGD